MTHTVVDLLRAQTECTLESSRMIANALRTAAFTVAYERVLDYHTESRNLEDQLEFARWQAITALQAAAKDLLEDPPSVVSSYELL